MFRLVVICVLTWVASVQCGTILAPAIGKLVSEKVIESHGNSVVHASAPLVAAAVAPALRYTLVPQPVAEIVPQQPKAALVAEGTIEAHGHQVVHDAQPLVAVAKPLAAVDAVVPAIATRGLTYAAAPIYYPTYYPHLVAEKTVSSYGHSIQHA